MRKVILACILFCLVGCEVAVGKSFFGGRSRYSSVSTNAAEIVVAASDASSEVKRAADYVCDGTADDVEIQAALDELDGVGGKVTVVAGSYELKSNVEVPSNVILEFMPGNAITVASDHTLDEDTTTITAEEIAWLVRNKNVGGTDTNIRIIGANIDFGGGASTSKYDEDKTYFGIWLADCSHSAIEDCVVDDVVLDVGAVSNHKCACIQFTNCDDSVISDCNVSGAGYEGIGVQGSCDNIRVVNCQSNNNGVHAMQISAWQNVLAAGNPQNVEYNGCYSVTSRQEDNCIFHGTASTARDFINGRIVNCIFPKILLTADIQGVLISGSNAQTINLQPSSSSTLQGITITGNLFTGDSVANHARIYSYNTNAVTGSFIKDVSITNNIFEQTGEVDEGCIRLSAGTSENEITMSRVVVSGNIFNQEAVNNNEMLEFGAGATDWQEISLTNNMFAGQTGSGISRFINLTTTGAGNLKRILISGNQFDGATSTNEYIYFYESSASGKIQDVLIKDNIYNVSASTYLIRVAPTANRPEIENLIIENNLITAGYLIATNDMYVDGLVIRNNDLNLTSGVFSGALSNVTNLQLYNNDGGSYTATASGALPLGDQLYLDSSGGALTMTLQDGIVTGQDVVIRMTDNTNSSTVTVAHHATSADEVFTFDAVGEYLILKWNGVEWVTIVATATT